MLSLLQSIVDCWDPKSQALHHSPRQFAIHLQSFCHPQALSWHCSAYKYIVWLNGSQRGPYLPAYAKRRMHWTEALTDRLSSKVKMVGATIHCGAPFDVPSVPHVQSYLVAVDQKGLEIVRKDVSRLKSPNETFKVTVTLTCLHQGMPQKENRTTS